MALIVTIVTAMIDRASRNIKINKNAKSRIYRNRLDIDIKADMTMSLETHMFGEVQHQADLTAQDFCACSGHMRKKVLVICLPRTASAMASVGKKVSLSEAKPGDLVFI